MLARLYLARADEAAPVADNAHAHALEPFLAVVGGDGADHAGNVILGGGVIHLRGDRGDTHVTAGLHRVGGMPGGQQRLGRHAAVIEAIAAHLATFQQGDIGAHLRRARGNRQATRAPRR